MVASIRLSHVNYSFVTLQLIRISTYYLGAKFRANMFIKRKLTHNSVVSGLQGESSLNYFTELYVSSYGNSSVD